MPHKVSDTIKTFVQSTRDADASDQTLAQAQQEQKDAHARRDAADAAVKQDLRALGKPFKFTADDGTEHVFATDPAAPDGRYTITPLASEDSTVPDDGEPPPAQPQPDPTQAQPA